METWQQRQNRERAELQAAITAALPLPDIALRKTLEELASRYRWQFSWGVPL